MEARQVKERFPGIERCIDRAAQLCRITKAVPEDLRACIRELDRESDETRQLLAYEDNDNRIIQSIEKLEKLGDRAVRACLQAGNTVDQEVQDAVQQAHDAISSLKHRLH
ncbi:MAG TPA: hypothetical protein VEC06_13210 [Paucimonas sp.]|nr:hypothetical protein [Paucimonas sp.]